MVRVLIDEVLKLGGDFHRDLGGPVTRWLRGSHLGAISFQIRIINATSIPHYSSWYDLLDVCVCVCVCVYVSTRRLRTCALPESQRSQERSMRARSSGSPSAFYHIGGTPTASSGGKKTVNYPYPGLVFYGIVLLSQ